MEVIQIVDPVGKVSDIENGTWYTIQNEVLVKESFISN